MEVDVIDSVTSAPLSAARVKLEQGVAADPVYGKVDRNGHFAFRNLTPGFYLLSIEAPGFHESRTSVDVSIPVRPTGGILGSISSSLVPRPKVSKAIDDGGRPTYSVSHPDQATGPSFQAFPRSTDTSFAMRHVAPGTYRLRYGQSDLRAGDLFAQMTVEVGDQDVRDLVVTPHALQRIDLEGQLVVREGGPPGSWLVYLQPPSKHGRDGSHQRRRIIRCTWSAAGTLHSAPDARPP
ncbi:MAG: carboxypeptidase-like regulatory domain-containing protein [Ignavibacteriota bacterium]